MLTRNSQKLRDSFALALVKDHALSLKSLQIALERCATEHVPLDLALADLKLLPSLTIAKAAEKANFVVTAEQTGSIEDPKDSTRSFARHGANMAVKFKDWDNLRVAYTNNISRGGLGIRVPRSSEAPPVDSMVHLSLSLPDGQGLDVRGRVCYRRDSEEHRHIGIQMHHTHTEDLLKIDKLVKSVSR